MSEGNLTTGDFKLSQLSSGPTDPPWAIAVFAHNEAKTIQRALESIITAIGNQGISIYVLANGCTDTTIERVHQSAANINNLWLLESKVADKASAWNLFVHEVLSNNRLAGLDICFFMDGDVTLAVDALELLAAALEQVPSAEAAGAMPATGRNKDAWRQRMPISGMLAGNCYALRSSFIQQIRERPVRMPVGLIGEDFFVSWLVASNVWRKQLTKDEDVRCIFHKEAEFAFRSLSPWSLTDCRTYMRRKWRYTLRGLQHQMLILLLMRQGLEAMPRNVSELYQKGPLPSRLSWCGSDTLLRFIAVLWIRAQRKRSSAEIDNLSTYRE
ncbi:MAG: glycosyltransferase family 2 protein [Pseudomonadales bacterium]|nr:glycosyltransferase family 2 protein [Pseudomonadales bacterium]